MFRRGISRDEEERRFRQANEDWENRQRLEAEWDRGPIESHPLLRSIIRDVPSDGDARVCGDAPASEAAGKAVGDV